MSGNSPLYVIVAALLAAVLLLGFWLRSEKHNSEAWLAEMKSQQARAEKLQQEGENLRSEAAHQRALAQERADEIQRLRGQTTGTTPQPIIIPPIDIQRPVQGNGFRNWGPEQATGGPDTPTAGDMTTAWASRSQDNQKEWLQLEYEAAVTVTKVKVYETFNPGALTRVTSVDDEGKETEIWAGKDPTPMNSGMGVSEVAAAGTPTTKRIKIYLDSPAVPGWNEIDAVGLVDDKGNTHWATKARASSSYADVNGPEAVPQGPVELPPREF